MRKILIKKFITCCISCAVIFSSLSLVQAESGDEESVYQKAYMHASETFNYEKATELLRTIEDYKDSKELINLYEKMKTSRFINGRFYWRDKEYVILLKQNLKTLDDYNNIEITDNEITTNGEISTTITISYDTGDVTIILHDVENDDNGNAESFGEIEIKANAGPLLVAPLVVAIAAARADDTVEEGKNIASQLLDLNPYGEISKDDLTFVFDNTDEVMTFFISGNTSDKYYCEAGECNAIATEIMEGIEGSLEHYCYIHYSERMGIVGDMEEGIESSDSSLHTCEATGCYKEGTNSITGFSGNLEYYCAEHYKEMEDVFSMMLQ